MTFLTILISWTVVFGIEWLLLSQLDDQTGRAGIVAFCITSGCLAYRIHAWKAAQIRALTSKKMGDYLLLFCISLLMVRALEFYFSDVKLADIQSWSVLFRVDGQIPFFLSPIIGVLGSAIIVGVFVENLILKITRPVGPLVASEIKSDDVIADERLAPRWAQLLAASPKLVAFVAFLPIVYALHLAKESNWVGAILVSLLWLPCYFWVLKEFNEWRLVRWPFSILGTVILAALGVMVVFPYGWH